MRLKEQVDLTRMEGEDPSMVEKQFNKSKRCKARWHLALWYDVLLGMYTWKLFPWFIFFFFGKYLWRFLWARKIWKAEEMVVYWEGKEQKGWKVKITTKGCLLFFLKRDFCEIINQPSHRAIQNLPLGHLRHPSLSHDSPVLTHHCPPLS